MRSFPEDRSDFGLESVINFVEKVSRKIRDNGGAVEKIYLYLTIHLLLVNHTMNLCNVFVPKCNFKFISNM